MQYLHSMIRVYDLDAALDFFVSKLGMIETRRKEVEAGRFTLVFLRTDEDQEASTEKGGLRHAPELELTYNWDNKDAYGGGRNFGHLAYRVKDIYAICQRLMEAGIVINRPPRDGHMAFVRSPDGISLELLQEGDPLEPAEPWLSMPNTGSW